MKICPACNQKYADDTLNFCLRDGTGLAPDNQPDQQTVIMGQPRPTGQAPQFGGKAVQNPGHGQIPQYNQQPIKKSRAWIWVIGILGVLVLVCGGGLIGALTLIPDAENFNFGSSVTENDPISNTPATKKPEAPKKATLKKENYTKLETGMTYEEVVEILGVEGEEISESGTGSFKTSVYMWRSDNFSFISIVFMNDKLFSKSRSGLD